MDDATLGIAQARAFDALHAPVAHAGKLDDPRSVSAKFEELLATQLVREMRRSLSDGFFGGGAGADIFEGWLDQHLGAEIARRGTLGLANSIEASLASKGRQP